MKKQIRKIQMWWWKKHNPKKYHEEYWKDVAKRIAESCQRATAPMAALAKALKEYNDTQTGANQNGHQTNR